MKEAEATVDGVTRKLKLMHKEASESGEILLKRALGGGADELVGTGLELLGGAKLGLAAFAVDQVAQKIKGTVDAVAEVKKEWDAGTMSAGEMREKIILSIPVINSIYEAEKSIYDLISGESKLEEDFNSSVEQNARRHEEVGKVLKENLEIIKELGKEAEQSAFKLAGDSYGGFLREASRRRDEDLRRIQEQRDKAETTLTGGEKELRLQELKEAEKSIEQTYANDTLEMNRRVEKQKLEIATRAGDELGAIKSEILQSQLKEQGNDLAAEIEAINQATLEKKAALERERNDSLEQRTWSENSEYLYQRAIEEIQNEGMQARETASKRDAQQRQKDAFDLYNQATAEANAKMREDQEWAKKQLEYTLQDKMDVMTRAHHAQPATLLNNRFHGLAEQQKDHNEEMLAVLRLILRQLERTPAGDQQGIRAIMAALGIVNGRQRGHVVRP